MVLIGIVASVVWYVLIGAAAWNGTSFVVGMLVAVALAGIATYVLIWRGDTGLGVGLGMMIGFALSFMFFVACWYVFLDSVEFG